MRTGWAAGGAPGVRRRLGEVLVAGKVLTDAQLNEALRVQREDKGRRRRLGEVITALGLADEVAIARALSDQLGLPFLDLGNLPIPDETLAVLPRNVAVRHGAVPVTITHDVLTVALADPTNVLALDDIRLATKLASVRTAVATASDIKEAIGRYYAGGAAGETFGSLADVEGLEATEEREEDLEQVGDVDDAPVVRLVNAIMGEALHSRASDIHVEPQERDVRVRYRIDGLLREVTVVPKAIQGPLISRIKILSGMDISERRKPQDGRGRIRLDRQEADTRVSSMPTMHGETVVIRLLRKETEKAKTLAEVGLDERDRVVVEQALGEPQGLILITGPTGSGKTSSLYAGLASVIRPDINVVTLEDPVEYQMRGVNQVQINERVGLTFAGGLRTILRQDPDIVMVGEIRDPETASIAMQASMTGHLVLSTLHTNDAPAAVSRLIDMGVEPFLITSSLTLVVGQRLARVPCSKCSEPVEADPRTLELLGLDPDQVDEAGLRSGPGCGFCAQTGYQGRLGLFEVVRVTRKIRELVVARATEVALKEEAVAGGMRSLRADGLAKALAGRTTLEEVLRVTPPDPDLARKASNRAGAPPPAQVPQAPRTPPKVLVLDDDHTIAEIAAAVLVDGYEVVAASHLDEGLRMVESEHPDLILVDLDLPGTDPGELLAILRAGARDLPFLVMSATDDRHTRDLATTSGATGFLSKPISEPQLRSEVAAVLQQRRSLVDRSA
ncbi:MAG TPA: ATPase, T2SS/T4P/T4SS family [Actinomycetes bacterium]|nr:ATPase, T2SS/T4P/T4SS family [Actinomycetes bacterium]